MLHPEMLYSEIKLKGIKINIKLEHLCVSAAYRAKLSMLSTVSRIRGQVRTMGYPQTEGMLGDCMLFYGRELGPSSEFGTGWFL